MKRSCWLPKYLSPDQVERVLGTCNRQTATGRRDYAILLLLARLGLRAGEVVSLRLDDVDWRTGELLVRGKGLLHDRMPCWSGEFIQSERFARPWECLVLGKWWCCEVRSGPNL